MLNNTIDINDITMKEETNVIVGDTKMLNNLRTKTITVEVQVHKELKKAEVENLFSMDGVFFEVKRRTIYATKEINLPKKGSSFMMVLAAENAAEYEIEDYVIETMQEFYIEKCHVYAAEHERKWAIEEAERIAKLKADGLIDEDGNDIEVEEEESIVVGETKMNEISVNDNAVEEKEETNTGETEMLNNGIFVYEEETNQNIHVNNDNCVFHNGWHYEQELEIYGDDFFNSVLKKVLEEYEIAYDVSGRIISFKNLLEEEEQDFEETYGGMVLEETKYKISKIIEGYPLQEIFKIKEDNEILFQGLIDYYYDS